MGDAQDSSKPSLFGGVVKRAKWDAWASHKGTPRNAAREEYAVLVGSFGAGFSIGRVTRRKSSLSLSSRSMGSFTNLAGAAGDGSATVPAPVDYASMDKAQLLKEVDSLQSELTKLQVFRVYKEGALSRCRETMTGEDWTVRFYEVKPGFLRCYKR